MTEGVKGACLVLVASTQGMTIVGRLGSTIMALDYAVRKRAFWLQELFGSTPHLPFDLFDRSRCDSSVTYSLNRRWCETLTVTLDGNQCDEQELKCLFERLLCLWGDKCTTIETPSIRLEVVDCTNAKPAHDSLEYIDTPPFFSHPHWSKVFRAEFATEANYALSNPAIISCSKRDELLKKVEKDEGYRSIAGSARDSLVSELDLELSSAHRIAPAEQAMLSSALSCPIRIAVGPGGIGTILILKYMRERLGYNVDFTYRFPHSQQIITVLQHEELGLIAEGIILDTSSAGRFLARGRRPKYRPLMLMPGTTNRLLRSGGTGTQDRYSQMNDEPSSAWLYLRRLQPNARIEPISEAKVITAFANQESDRQGILWWPYCMFQEILSLAKRDETLPNLWEYDLTSLFVHESLLSDKRALSLNLGIRQAWRAVRKDADFRANAIDELLSDPSYTNALYRFNALGTLREADFDSLQIDKRLSNES